MKTPDVNIRIDRETYKRLKIGCAKRGMTLKRWVASLAKLPVTSI